MLQLADDLSLPGDAATRRMAILAMSGAGKSNAAVLLAEQMYDAGIPWVAIDPKGDWWGMRAPGRQPGLPIPILGGLHGDIPLDPRGGRIVADLIVDQRVTAILDVSEFDSNQQMWGFLRDFGDQLYRRKSAERWPLHLFLDEADQYLPQTTRESGNLPACLNVYLRVVTKGRQRGIGSTIVSQRSATVHKDALYMAEALFAMRTVGPRTRGDRPVIAGWFDEHALDGRAIIDILPTLVDGAAILSSPVWLGIQTQSVLFDRRRTYDSGSTPSLTESARPVATLADIDLPALSERMAATIERAKADDPEALRARIRELEAAQKQDRSAEVERLQAERDDLRRIVDTYGRLFGNVLGMMDDIGESMTMTAADIRAVWHEPEEREASNVISMLNVNGEREYAQMPRPGNIFEHGTVLVDRAIHEPVSVANGDLLVTSMEYDDEGTPTGFGPTTVLRAGARRMLAVLCAFPEGITREQLSTLSGVQKGGTFSQYLRSLVAAGYVAVYTHNVIATTAGHQASDRSVAIPRSPQDVVALYAPRLRAGARRMLDILMDVYPQYYTRDGLSKEAGIAKGGTFSQYLRSLIRNGLAEETASGVRAGPTLYMFRSAS